jgi:lipoprotein signal peptidase
MNQESSRLVKLIAAVCLLVIADQVSKTIVREALAPGSSIPLIDGVLQIAFTQNERGFSWWVPALPIWAEWVFRTLLVVLALTAFPVHLFYTQTRRRSIWADLAVVGITASSCGHLLDDLLAPYTADFIQVFHSPSANLADVYAYAGIGALVVEMSLLLRLRRARWRGFRHLWTTAVRTRNEFLRFITGRLRSPGGRRRPE